MRYKLFQGDCLKVMQEIPDRCIDLVLTDPPYGTTACKWDSVIPLEPMWEQIKRIIKSNSAICLFGSQPFTSILITSNLKMFRYDILWIKSQATGFYNANRMPLRAHEEVSIFYNSLPIYNPQKTPGIPYILKKGGDSTIYGKDSTIIVTENKSGDRHPFSWCVFKRDKNKIHPTQKPVALMEYLIKTYTNENAVVLDFTMGSGTTGVACMNLNRRFIGIELDQKYFEIAEKRIKEG